MENKFTVEEIASKLKVSKKTILREIQRGKLKTEKVGRRYLISEVTLNNYLHPEIQSNKSETVEIEDDNQLSFPKENNSQIKITAKKEHVYQEIDSDNCGPSCLSMVYKLKGQDISLEEISNDLKLGSKGECTYPPQLAGHLVNHGLKTNLLVSNSQFISPAWNKLGRQDLMDNLKNWLVFQPKHDWHLYGLHTLFYLEDGGHVELRSISVDYLKRTLEKGSILILCIDEVWIWGHRLKEHEGSIDDLRSKSWGHFVVVKEYTGDKFSVLDPYPTNLPGKEGVYEVNGDDLVSAVLTWSGTIVEVLE